MAFVHNYLSRGDDVSTRPDTGDVGTGRGCGRMVVVSVGVGGTGMTQLTGLRTSKTPRMRLLLHCLWLSHSGLCPLLCSHMDKPRPRNLDICIRFQGEQWGCRCRYRCRCKLVLVMPMRVSRIGHIRRTSHKRVLWVACCWY